jgi:hypothetical protein
VTMDFMITVAVPLSGDRFAESVQELKDAGMFYVHERKCWVGEIAADLYDDVFNVVGEFVWDTGHVSSSYKYTGGLNGGIDGNARKYLLYCIDKSADLVWHL